MGMDVNMEAHYVEGSIMMTCLVLVGLLINAVISGPSVAYHNPGNLVKSNSVWIGETERQGRFTAFESAHYGLRALCIVILRYEQRHHVDTLEKFVHRFAPCSENNCRKYIHFLSRELGIGRRQKISLSAVLPSLVKAVIKYEQGSMPYNDAQLLLAIVSARTYVTLNQ